MNDKKIKKKTNTSIKTKNTPEKGKEKSKLKKTKSKDNIIPFEKEIENFVAEIESLSKALDSIGPTLINRLKSEEEKFKKFIDEEKGSKVEKDGSIEYTVRVDNLTKFKQILKELRSSILALKNVPRIFFCSLISQYDAYLGRLLRVAFYSKPELLNSSEKLMTFSELLKFKSLESARESIVEKEIESVIRDSHIKQFKWMEQRFAIPLTKELEIWPSFVEVTERRNLFMHCDGVISNQYLTICEKEGFVFDKKVEAGDELDISEKYFQSAFECIYEIGVKLGQVLWRKLIPRDIEKATICMQEITFGLLEQERYNLAKNLLLFTTEILKKHSSDARRRIDRINLAIAYKFSGNSSKCKEVIASDDWSACEEQFKLAVAVLEDRFKDASKIMLQIGKDGQVSRTEYSTWPLFRDFRKSKEFLKVYKELFGEEMTIQENKPLEIKANN